MAFGLFQVKLVQQMQELESMAEADFVKEDYRRVSPGKLMFMSDYCYIFFEFQKTTHPPIHLISFQSRNLACQIDYFLTRQRGAWLLLTLRHSLVKNVPLPYIGYWLAT